MCLSFLGQNYSVKYVKDRPGLPCKIPMVVITSQWCDIDRGKCIYAASNKKSRGMLTSHLSRGSSWDPVDHDGYSTINNNRSFSGPPHTPKGVYLEKLSPVLHKKTSPILFCVQYKNGPLQSHNNKYAYTTVKKCVFCPLLLQ